MKEQLKNTDAGQNAATRAGEREARERERWQTAPDAERRGQPERSTRDGGATGDANARVTALDLNVPTTCDLNKQGVIARSVTEHLNKINGRPNCAKQERQQKRKQISRGGNSEQCRGPSQKTSRNEIDVWCNGTKARPKTLQS